MKTIKIYKLSKRPLILIYGFLGLLLLLIKYAMDLIAMLIERYLHNTRFADYYVLLPIWIITAAFAVLVLPFYFHKAAYTVSSKEITAKSGLLMTTRQFMMTSSVKSVSTVILPLGGLTGMNFVVLNALGARLLIPFLSKRDAAEITEIVNNSIRARGDEAHD